ncbi:MAG: CNP1-like family protein [Rhizobium sp.]|nr:CNP1-like family protein [Rhizobium sp.]
MKRFILACCALAAGVGAWAQPVPPNRVEAEETVWTEDEVALPAYPQADDLREFYVSELTAHKFFVDASTLSVGKDGVVRYTLVVRTGGGATNVSFEGIRCATGELKLYASGHRDGTWAKSRQSEWRPIENKLANRQHVSLFRDLFCPFGVPIKSPAEGREALNLGRHPGVTKLYK